MAELKRIALEMLQRWEQLARCEYAVQGVELPAHYVRLFAEFKARIDKACEGEES